MDKNIFTESLNCDENYKCQIIKIEELRKANKSDYLQVATVGINEVIVGLDIKIGDVMVYVPCNCILNTSFLSYNNLFEKPELNRDQTKKGYFSSKARTKAIRLRENESTGFLCTINDINEWLLSIDNKIFLPIMKDLVVMGPFVGTTFDTVNGELFVKKYVPKIVKTQGQEGSTKRSKADKHLNGFDRLVPNQLRLHPDTNQLANNIHKLNPTDWITITYKIHGTSGQSAKILTNKKLDLSEKVLKKFGVNIQTKVYDSVFTSRNVVKDQYVNKNVNPHGFYGKGDTQARLDVHKSLLEHMENSMCLSYEIGGYVKGTSTPWQKLRDMIYDYGCKEGEQEVYVYKQTLTNNEGWVYTLPFKQMKLWCDSKGIKTVPLLWEGYAKDLYPELDVHNHWHKNFLNLLKIDKRFYMEDNCFMCKSSDNVDAEGIVLRIDNLSFDVYKLKCKRFTQREDESIEDGEIDIETQESLGNTEESESN